MSQTHGVTFTKYHGTGNDFLVVDATDPVPDRAAFARTYCDRETGVRAGADGRRGADGVLFLHVEDRYTPSRVIMTLVQPDGSTAAMCGNGARVVAAWAHERTGEREFMIDTQSGTRYALVHDAPDRPAGSVDDADVVAGGAVAPAGDAAPTAGDTVATTDDTVATADDDTVDNSTADRPTNVEIEMGEPSFEPAAIPATVDEPLLEAPVAAEALREAGVPDAEDITVTAVNTGVPHAVVFVDDVDARDLDRIAEPIRHADVFPEGANVNLAERVPDAAVTTFRQRTFERGVEGETRSCGTGAVAIAAAATRTDRVDGDTVATRPPGGRLSVTLDGDVTTLSGPVKREFSGDLAADPR